MQEPSRPMEYLPPADADIDAYAEQVCQTLSEQHHATFSSTVKPPADSGIILNSHPYPLNSIAYCAHCDQLAKAQITPSCVRA